MIGTLTAWDVPPSGAREPRRARAPQQDQEQSGSTPSGPAASDGSDEAPGTEQRHLDSKPQRRSSRIDGMGAGETEIYAVAAVQFQLEFPRTQMGAPQIFGAEIRRLLLPVVASRDAHRLVDRR